VETSRVKVSFERSLFERICSQVYNGKVPEKDKRIILYWLSARKSFIINAKESSFKVRKNNISKWLDENPENGMLETAVRMITNEMGKKIQ